MCTLAKLFEKAKRSLSAREISQAAGSGMDPWRSQVPTLANTVVRFDQINKLLAFSLTLKSQQNASCGTTVCRVHETGKAVGKESILH